MAFLRSAVVVTTLCICLIFANSEGEVSKKGPRKSLFPCGDGAPSRLEVLPGGGWDNLRNVDMGRITYSNYSGCKITEDGRYILPDNTFVVPLKQSRVSAFASLYDHWTNYSSTTSTTINAEAHGSFFFGSISGSYSQSHRSIKKSQVEDKAVTTRVQLRHTMYKVKTQPDAQLHPGFKSRLLEIAAHLQSNGTAQASYLAAQLIRDFGTHVITSIDAGAVIAKIDNIKKTFVSKYNEDYSKVKAAASASFFHVFGIGGSYSRTVDKKLLDEYTKSQTTSYTEAWGGPPFRANFSISSWENMLYNNLVAVDRSGDPLHFVITSAVLPELPEPTLWDLAGTVENAIKQYYTHNRYRGCMDPSSKNFNFQANEDDGTCEARSTNFTFGGVYQTCAVQGSPGHNPCSGLLQKNPKTRNFNCPTHYQAIKINQGTTSSNCYRSCHGSWFWRGCSTHCGYGIYSTFWCVATKDIPQSSGFIFGGIYSKTIANPLTKSQSCPPKFYAQMLGASMHICISDDYELGSRYSVGFGGFFSCSTGNPLALTIKGSNSIGELMAFNAVGFSGSMPMNAFLYAQGPKKWPKSCPHGFSQHLAGIENNCEVMYCVKAKAFSVQGLPPIRRPPFTSAPGISRNTTIPLVIVNNDRGTVYFQDIETTEWQMATKSSVKKITESTGNVKSAASESSKDGVTPGFAAGISVIGTLVFAVVVVALFTKCKTRSRSSRDQRLISVDRYQSMPSRVVEDTH